MDITKVKIEYSHIEMHHIFKCGAFFHALSKNKNKIYFLSKQGGATWKSNQQAIIKYHTQFYV